MATRKPFERDLSDMFNYLLEHCPKGPQFNEILYYEVVTTMSTRNCSNDLYETFFLTLSHICS